MLEKTVDTKKKRKRLAVWQREMIIARYAGARTRAQKEALAVDVHLTLPQLHGAAYRLGVSHPARGPGAAGRATRQPLLSGDAQPFGPTEEHYLRSEFGRLPIEQVAAFLNRSEPEVAYRARLLGLRKPIRFYDAQKAADWLGLPLERLRGLSDQGVDVHDLLGRLGRKVALVETIQLARWLTSDDGVRTLDTTIYDPFFVREVINSVRAVANGEAEFSPRWLSHGHTCLNPVAAAFGRFCAASADREPGDDPKCPARLLTLDQVKQMSSSFRRN